MEEEKKKNTTSKRGYFKIYAKIRIMYLLVRHSVRCSGEVNLNDWEEVWQYGSDEESDPLWLQDGVAPQCMPKGITRTNRAFIPSTEKQGFVDSHDIDNYGWIFTRKITENGYVTPRK